MKTTLLTFIALAFLNFVNAQNFEEYLEIKFDSKADYLEHEDKAIECADYIFSIKLEDPGKKKKQAGTFLLIWMIGAPYTFEIWSWSTSLSKKNNGFFMLYMAAITKAKLANKEITENEVQIKAAQLIYDYIKNPEMRVQQKGYIKKFTAAGNSGNLYKMVKK